MACDTGCNECQCEEVNTRQESEKIYGYLNDKLRVLFETVCYINNIPCVRLPSFMAKVTYMIWCLLRDLVNFTLQFEKDFKGIDIEKMKKALETAVRAEYKADTNTSSINALKDKDTKHEERLQSLEDYDKKTTQELIDIGDRITDNETNITTLDNQGKHLSVEMTNIRAKFQSIKDFADAGKEFVEVKNKVKEYDDTIKEVKRYNNQTANNVLAINTKANNAVAASESATAKVTELTSTVSTYNQKIADADAKGSSALSAVENLKPSIEEAKANASQANATANEASIKANDAQTLAKQYKNDIQLAKDNASDALSKINQDIQQVGQYNDRIQALETKSDNNEHTIGSQSDKIEKVSNTVVKNSQSITAINNTLGSEIGNTLRDTNLDAYLKDRKTKAEEQYVKIDTLINAESSDRQNITSLTNENQLRKQEIASNAESIKDNANRITTLEGIAGNASVEKGFISLPHVGKQPYAKVGNIVTITVDHATTGMAVTENALANEIIPNNLYPAMPISMTLSSNYGNNEPTTASIFFYDDGTIKYTNRTNGVRVWNGTVTYVCK